MIKKYKLIQNIELNMEYVKPVYIIFKYFKKYLKIIYIIINTNE